MSVTPRLSLPELSEAQASKYLTHNEALRMLDALVQCTCINRTTTAPPGSPSTGDAYLVASPATGAWAGLEDHYVIWDGTAWDDIEPFPFMLCADANAQELLVWNETVSPAVWSVFAVITVGLSFTDLNDTFASYTGKGGYRLRVNAAENAVEAALAVESGELTPSGSPLDISPTVAADKGEAFYYVSEVLGPLFIENPTGSGLNWQSKLVFRITSTDPQTLSFDTAYRESTGLPFPGQTTGGGLTDYLLFCYNAQDAKWDFLAYNFGY